MKKLALGCGLATLALASLPVHSAGRCMPLRQCAPGPVSNAAPDDSTFPELAAAASLSASNADTPRDLPLIAPINSLPGGQTYGRWAVEWQQWVVSNAVNTSPILDQTGANCGERQVGKVWFLAGVFGTEPVSRSCTIPAGKALFFPMINSAYFAYLDDPPEFRTDAFVRSASTCSNVDISIWIDGIKVPRPTRFFTGPGGSPSPLFNAQLPPNNIFGAQTDPTVPNYARDLALVPSGEQGYYLFVYPLSTGSHKIRWIAHGCTTGGMQDITYHLTVSGK